MGSSRKDRFEQEGYATVVVATDPVGLPINGDDQELDYGIQYDNPSVKPNFRLAFEFVTPVIASRWLEKNKVNRKMTRFNVDKHCRALRSKRFGTTHHGVAFNKAGFLVDGQHRLKAISETGIGVWLVVARDMDVERAIDLPVDIGTARSKACMLEKSSSTVEIASALIKIIVGSNHDAHDVDRMHGVIESQAMRLHEFCNTRRATKSAVMSRAAVVLQMIRNPEFAEDLCKQYRDYVLLENVGEIWPSVMSLVRQADSKTISSFRQNELFVRTFMAFDPTKKHTTKIYVKDEVAAMSMLRGYIRELLSK